MYHRGVNWGERYTWEEGGHGKTMILKVCESEKLERESVWVYNENTCMRIWEKEWSIKIQASVSGKDWDWYCES